MKQTTHLTDDLGGNIRFIKMTVNGKAKLISYPAEPEDKIDTLVMVCVGRPSQ